MLWNQKEGVVAQHCESTNRHCIVHIKRLILCYVNFTLIKKKRERNANGHPTLRFHKIDKQLGKKSESTANFHLSLIMEDGRVTGRPKWCILG